MMMLKEREKSKDKDKYNDILALMMKVRDSEEMAIMAEDEDNSKAFAGAKKCYMTDKMISRTLMQFFADGYDTTGSQIAVTLYYLAIHQEMQVKNGGRGPEMGSQLRNDLL